MKNDIKKNVLEKIKADDIKLRSKNFFKVLKLFILSLIIFLALGAIYIFNLSFYLPRRAGVFSATVAPPILINSIPWTLIFLGSLIIGVLIYIYNKYEGGYKKNLFWTIVVISFLVVVFGGIVSKTNLNENLEKRPKFRRFYESGQRNFIPGENRRFRPGERRHLPYLLENNEIF